jgi:hypothetical protein
VQTRRLPGFRVRCPLSVCGGLLPWLSRAERLAARWPLIILTALHAAVLLAGALGYLSGAIVDDAIRLTAERTFDDLSPDDQQAPASCFFGW